MDAFSPRYVCHRSQYKSDSVTKAELFLWGHPDLSVFTFKIFPGKCNVGADVNPSGTSQPPPCPPPPGYCVKHSSDFNTFPPSRS